MGARRRKGKAKRIQLVTCFPKKNATEPRVACPYTQSYMVPKQNSLWLQGARKGRIYNPPLLLPASIPAREPTAEARRQVALLGAQLCPAKGH